jgi:hypothetical protein
MSEDKEKGTKGEGRKEGRKENTAKQSENHLFDVHWPATRQTHAGPMRASPIQKYFLN